MAATRRVREEQLLVAGVGDRRLALRVHDVVEVQRMVAVDPLPRAPEVVLGVIDLRGTVVPVLSLHARFGLPPEPPTVDDRLVVVDVHQRRVALHVGPAVDLETVDAQDIADVTPDAAAYGTGIARLADGLVLIHDIAAFLSSDEIVALDDALAAADERR